MRRLESRYRKLKKDSNIEAPFGLPDSEVTTIGLNMWARSAPKQTVFNRYIELANQLGLGLNVYVDDLCSRAILARTNDTQDETNKQYVRYFKPTADSIVFSSDVLSNFTLREFIDIADRISVQEFEKNILPEKKRSLSNARLSEIGHALLQIAFLGEIAKNESLLLCGKFSLGVMYAAREVYNDFPKVITLPREADL